MSEATFYRTHPNQALRRAYWRGADAAAEGLPITVNPYRKVSVIRRARRGSWSEGFTRAWALGWRAQMRLGMTKRLKASAAGGSGHQETVKT